MPHPFWTLMLVSPPLSFLSNSCPPFPLLPSPSLPFPPLPFSLILLTEVLKVLNDLDETSQHSPAIITHFVVRDVCVCVCV